MSCKCDIEIGDYSHCFVHGDGTEWAKRQELELPSPKVTLESITAELKELRDAVSKGQTENNSRGDYWRERALKAEADLKEQTRQKLNYFDQVQEILGMKRVAEARAEKAILSWPVAINALIKIRGASRKDDLPKIAADALGQLHYYNPEPFK